MNIEYVVSSMVFWGRENKLSFEPECQLLKSLGFGIELWPNNISLDECRYSEKNWPRLVNATEGMLVSMRSRNDTPDISQWAEQIECAQLELRRRHAWEDATGGSSARSGGSERRSTTAR